MEKQAYIVTGATGNIGKVLAEKLLARGKKVRVIGRSKERLEPLVDKGAEPFVGSLDDATFLTNAFQNARVVFAMIPPNFTATDFRAYENQVGEALATAIRDAGVTHVINLSSVGAHLEEGTGPIKGLHDNEQRLNRLDGVNVVHLRPGFFMENLLFNVETIRNMGINGGPIDPELPIPMIATKDIAAVAARLMEERSFRLKSVRELLGPEDVSMAEVTKVLGKAVDIENLRYVQFSYDDARRAMIGLGMSVNVADEMIEMYRGMNENRVRPTEIRSPDNTTPTRLEEFAETFAAVYRAGVPA